MDLFAWGCYSQELCTRQSENMRLTRLCKLLITTCMTTSLTLECECRGTMMA